MKQNWCIILLSFSILLSKNKNLDVNHMFVQYDGLTTECFIDSMDTNLLYFVPKDSVDQKTVNLKEVYYAYNDFDRVFYYSWSFNENLNRIQNTTGKVYTISGDTIDYIDIQFNKDMINPEAFIKINVNKSTYVNMLSIERIETDFSILKHSVKRGFHYSYYPFLILTSLDLFLKWDSKRRYVPQIWDNYNDLFPGIATIGLQKTGVTYQSFTSVIPSSVIISMLYDYKKRKNIFHFTPTFKQKTFDREMKIFSFKQVLKEFYQKILYKIKK
ncbi:MAG: hypothetical protein HOI03_05595 [Candidatus Marinimicrobia bacterium]|jgi:hypothetical protein|nr:hypothetical protein [Candidatus Neomarinimicrobiota bacterium]